MRNNLRSSIITLSGILLFGSFAAAQSKQQTEPPPPLREGSASILDKLAAEGTGGAAPKRDLTGFWGSSVGQKIRSEEHTSELQSHLNLVCRLLLEKKKNKIEKN